VNAHASIPVAIVSGGTFGLGLSITVTLARRGYRVLAFGLKDMQPASTAVGFEAIHTALQVADLHAQVDVLEADVSKVADVARVIQHALSYGGRIAALVNNAAIGPLGTVLTTDAETAQRILAVNVLGMVHTARAVIPHMTKAGGGAIVNIGSGAGYGKPNMALYAASKGAVLALSAAMAYDHFHDHIRVNVAIPGGGGIVSGMSVGRVGGDLAAFSCRSVPGTVAGRPATGEDLAHAVAFLLSDEAAAITGTVLDVGCFAGQGGPVPIVMPHSGDTHAATR